MESLYLPKINTKMLFRTKSVEMSKIMSTSEIHLHHASVNPGALKLEEATTRGVQ